MSRQGLKATERHQADRKQARQRRCKGPDVMIAKGDFGSLEKALVAG